MLLAIMSEDFHGFYYTQKNKVLSGLKLSAGQMETMTAAWAASFDLISYETYWKKLARYMITHAPQGYIAWHGVPHWIIGNCDRLIGTSGADENGANLIQFNADKTVAYQWITSPADPSEDRDPIYDLVFTPWDWLLSGDGDDRMFPLSKSQIKHLGSVMNWTNAMHADLEARWPSQQHWS